MYKYFESNRAVKVSLKLKSRYNKKVILSVKSKN